MSLARALGPLERRRMTRLSSVTPSDGHGPSHPRSVRAALALLVLAVGAAALLPLTADADPGPALVLTPQSATSHVGTPFTLTATVTDNGTPVADALVRFQFIAPSVNNCCVILPPTPPTLNGQATLTYTGHRGGTDTIEAWADTDLDGVKDAGEPSDTATKRWTTDPPASGHDLPRSRADLAHRPAAVRDRQPAHRRRRPPATGWCATRPRAPTPTPTPSAATPLATRSSATRARSPARTP